MPLPYMDTYSSCDADVYYVNWREGSNKNNDGLFSGA